MARPATKTEQQLTIAHSMSKNQTKVCSPRIKSPVSTYQLPRLDSVCIDGVVETRESDLQYVVVSDTGERNKYRCKVHRPAATTFTTLPYARWES